MKPACTTASNPPSVHAHPTDESASERTAVRQNESMQLHRTPH
ncbi:MAG: hypothetical protein ACREOZ_03310 [Gloeomargaritales cyanobacterium]